MKTQSSQVKLRPFSFGPDSEMFKVCVSGDLSDALDLAASLAGGINQICTRMDEAVNNDAAIICCGELRSIAFLGEVVEALVRSVKCGIQDSESEGAK